jgi:hypothetical protein
MEISEETADKILVSTHMMKAIANYDLETKVVRL